MIIYRERRPRNGVHICHLFRDCKVALRYPLDTVRTDSDRIPVCDQCRRMSAEAQAQA